MNENYSIHKSLVCISISRNISHELEPKLILGPYTEHREVLFKEQNALGQSSWNSGKSCVLKSPRTYLLSILEALITWLLS